MNRRALPLLLTATLAGCSPAYVYQAWRGQSRLMSSRRPIPEVVKDPSTAPALRDRLLLVEDIRRFAFDQMGIPPSNSYTSFAPVPGEAVTWAVTAARKTRLEAKTWWFPFVGRVPYKGYFDRAAAEGEGDALAKDGWDVFVGGVAAYSTLRWFDDPVVSTMLGPSAGELAETLLHELTHTAVYFKGQTDFDESAATYFGEQGAQDFLARRFGPQSRELEDYQRRLAREEARSTAVDELYAELAALYASPVPDAEKLRRREDVFARYRERLELRRLDNAVVLAHRRYHYDLDDFRKAREKLGGDWRKTLALLKSLEPRRPREALKRWLLI